jgi:hypothetical protein
LIKIADACGVPVGIGDFVFLAIGKKKPDITIYDHNCGFEKKLCPLL